jgi:hypothetical protein
MAEDKLYEARVGQAPPAVPPLFPDRLCLRSLGAVPRQSRGTRGTFGMAEDKLYEARVGQAPPAVPPPLYRWTLHSPVGGGGPARPGHAELL